MTEEDAFGAVTAVAGFKAAGLACGIKKEGADLALLDAGRCIPAAAVFTTSLTAAPPVKVCEAHLAQSPHARAIILTSGIANAGTGEPGLKAAQQTAAEVATALDCETSDVLVCSTGVIGPQLPMPKIVAGLKQAVSQLSTERQAGHDAATAIMTTDTRAKETLHQAQGFVVGGLAKGAAMVRPDMATMLAVVVSDAEVAPDVLQRALRKAVDASFNSINIDGCQSTNDTVIALASGDSGVAPDEQHFTDALTVACRDLARQIVADAECAKRIITLRISGAADEPSAREMGKFVADSDLVRASFYGGDSNWGRIFQALGVCGIPIDANAIDVSYAGVPICVSGMQVGFDEAALLARLDAGDFTIDIKVGAGSGQAEILTCDLTPEYVSFNGERS